MMMRIVYVLIIVMLFCSYASGQKNKLVSEADIVLIKKHSKSHNHTGHKRSIMQSPDEHFLSKYNPLTLSLKYTMLFYQRVISPQIAASCPYRISCSQFCKKSIEKYGIIKGVALGADRLSRCNNQSTDEVPPFKYTMQPGKQIKDHPDDYQLKQ